MRTRNPDPGRRPLERVPDRSERERWGSAVLLLHTPAGEEAHLDLMIAPPGWWWDAMTDRSARVLRAWRLDRRVDLEHGCGDAVRSVGAVTLSGHRALYLDFEGTMSGGRGGVRRLARGRGRCDAGKDGFERISSDLRWFFGVFRVVPVRAAGGDAEDRERVVIERDGDLAV